LLQQFKVPEDIPKQITVVLAWGLTKTALNNYLEQSQTTVANAHIPRRWCTPGKTAVFFLVTMMNREAGPAEQAPEDLPIKLTSSFEMLEVPWPIELPPRPSKRGKLNGYVCVAMLATRGPNAAFGDDFNPPPWDRNDPFATSAEWDFPQPLRDDNDNDFRGDELWQPDGQEVPFNSGDSGHGTFITYSPAGDIAWDGEGLIVTSSTGDGGQIHIHFDDEPFKLLRIRITGTSSFSSDPIPNEGVLVEGFDDTDGPVTAERESSGFAQDSATGDFSWGQDWRLEPNPDWEQIGLNVAPDTEIQQIVADAISMPESTSLALLGLGGLVLARRRTGS